MITLRLNTINSPKSTNFPTTVQVHIYILLLLTAIGLSPGGSSPTLVQTKIKIHKRTITKKLQNIKNNKKLQNIKTQNNKITTKP
jgi:DNA invertase Pin-like site-specific DNA recombinase